MYRHKSFVLGSLSNRKKTSLKKPPSIRKRREAVRPSPKIQDGPTIIAHYDKDESISLSLPQSLVAAFELECDYIDSDNASNRSHPVGHSLSQSDSELDYSEANDYFSEAQSEEIMESSDPSKNTSNESTRDISETQNNKNISTEDNRKLDVSTKNEKNNGSKHQIAIPESDKIREEDLKFQNDLKAIMEGKKAFDKDREKKDSSKISKNKGRVEKKGTEENEIEEKLKNEHAIFDKIAQSMEMADTYDFGSIAMDKKFDDLEKDTDEEFSKKLHALIEEGNKKELKNETGKVSKISEQDLKNKWKSEINEDAKGDLKSEKKAAIKTNQKDGEHGNRADNPTDEDSISDANISDSSEQVDSAHDLAKQASFSSTISIKNRNLKSRVFRISNGSLNVMIDSHWNPPGCSTIPELNVTLSERNSIMPDADHGTQRFRIGGPDTHSWSNLPDGDYYLTFFFNTNTNPHCQLTGSIIVTT